MEIIIHMNSTPSIFNTIEGVLTALASLTVLLCFFGIEAPLFKKAKNIPYWNNKM